MNKAEARDALLDKKLVRFVKWAEDYWCSFNFETMHITNYGGDHVDWTGFDDDDQFVIFHPIKVKPKKVIHHRRKWVDMVVDSIKVRKSNPIWALSKGDFDKYCELKGIIHCSEEWEEKEFGND